ncbi:flagellar biosynthesis anti-sigma factor FlgM [Legionella sp. CNM-4043-24]|uniref:flagellar biosynthesis anti-sigma factor FlgM n=1 Tax=Legionella sp. CNM-4043-24 TaxID=3421646 RepID=UPI00403B3814
MSEVEERMIIEVRRKRQQTRRQSPAPEQQSFNPEQFGLNLKSLAALKKAVLEAPSLDLLRIEQFRQEIASGSYQISSAGIAAKILA